MRSAHHDHSRCSGDIGGGLIAADKHQLSNSRTCRSDDDPHPGLDLRYLMKHGPRRQRVAVPEFLPCPDISNGDNTVARTQLEHMTANFPNNANTFKTGDERQQRSCTISA